MFDDVNLFGLFTNRKMMYFWFWPSNLCSNHPHSLLTRKRFCVL